MKKLTITAALFVFGTVFMTAQTTSKKNSTTKLPEKSANRGMKSTTGETKMVDTANLDKRQKIEDDKIIKRSEPQRDGLNNEASKPSPSQPAPGQLE